MKQSGQEKYLLFRLCQGNVENFKIAVHTNLFCISFFSSLDPDLDQDHETKFKKQNNSDPSVSGSQAILRHKKLYKQIRFAAIILCLKI